MKALKTLSNNKTPGSDGFPPELYKFFWSDLKYFLYDSLQYSFSKNELSIEQKRGIISLTPKKSKDRLFLKNWRPITLLNTDYKILAKLLALRLSTLLDSVIHEDQSEYIRNRYIGDNIRTVADLVPYIKIKNLMVSSF